MTGAPPTHPPPAGFASAEECRAVMERALDLMCDDPQVGPRLREVGTSECFRFSDLGLRVVVRPGAPGERNLMWTWDEGTDWEPKVTLTMTSEVANRFFQGQENVAVAVARRRIRIDGDAPAALALLPLIRPLFARVQEMLSEEYPHLALTRH